MLRLFTCTMIFIFFTLAILTTHTGTQSGFKEKHLEARRGDEVIIPCTDHGDTTHIHFFQWFLTNDNKNKSVIIFHNVKTGGKRASNDLGSRSKTLRDFSLVIPSFRETDQGVYSCETCSKATLCTKGFETSLSLITEPPPAVMKRLYAAKGDNVSYPCPDGVEGSGLSISRGVQRFGEALQRKQLHPKASILIQDVRSEDAGIYSCWREDDSGQRQNLLMINLCVLTAEPVSLSLGPRLNCSVNCDVGSEPVGRRQAQGNSTVATVVVVETGAVTFHVFEPFEMHEKPVVCHVTDTGASWLENSTRPLHSNGEQNNYEDKDSDSHWMLYCVLLASSLCTSATVLLCMLMCRQRICIAFSSDDEPHPGAISPECDRVAKHETLEEGIEMIYSVLEIKRPEEDRVVVNEEECVYSRIQFAAEVD
ncbi:hypothetical protein GJAV_G00009920 [Gymnothorax javanicus]|nr:hypothetical protein GJAV_G00009920 [Gymnothorax javanicus]